eukprot:c39023_g1_i1 orf=3-179(-)
MDMLVFDAKTKEVTSIKTNKDSRVLADRCSSWVRTQSESKDHWIRAVGQCEKSIASNNP